MIVITGARGLLGATLMRTMPEAVALQSDITDAGALAREIAALGPISHIIHTAALTDVGACEKDPVRAHAVNVEGTKHVVDSARSKNARLLYISTVSVFSGAEGNYRESDVPSPKNVHNTTKAEGEQHVLAYEKGTVVRLNLVGIHPDGTRGKNFIEWIYGCVQDNKDMTAFADVWVNPLSNWTIAAILKEMIGRVELPPVVHLASEDTVSKADIVERIARRFPSYTGTIIRGSVDAIPDGVIRPKEMWLDADYTKEALGLIMPSIDEEIEIIFAHLTR